MIPGNGCVKDQPKQVSPISRNTVTPSAGVICRWRRTERQIGRSVHFSARQFAEKMLGINTTMRGASACELLSMRV
jgi:hypothetical protein